MTETTIIAAEPGYRLARYKAATPDHTARFECLPIIAWAVHMPHGEDRFCFGAVPITAERISTSISSSELVVFPDGRYESHHLKRMFATESDALTALDPSKEPPGVWVSRLGVHVNHGGMWLDSWGPPPGALGCFAPAYMLTGFARSPAAGGQAP